MTQKNLLTCLQTRLQTHPPELILGNLCGYLRASKFFMAVVYDKIKLL